MMGDVKRMLATVTALAASAEKNAIATRGSVSMAWIDIWHGLNAAKIELARLQRIERKANEAT